MISPNEHPWVSDACAHAVHDECPGVCKYCSAACVCGCHHTARTAVPVSAPTPPRGQRFTRTNPAAISAVSSTR